MRLGIRLLFLNFLRVLCFSWSITRLSAIIFITQFTGSYLEMLRFNKEGVKIFIISPALKKIEAWGIIIIEIITIIIRSGTLLIRLITNLITGHLCLSLFRISKIRRVFLARILFYIKSAVYLVQAFVFAKLMAEYYSECL